MLIYFTSCFLIVLYGVIFFIPRKPVDVAKPPGNANGDIQGNISELNRKLFLVLSFGQLWLILALRHTSVGHDLEASYIPRYLNLGMLPWDELLRHLGQYCRNGEYGYLFYQKIVYMFVGDNIQLFLAVTAFCTLFPVAVFIYKYSNNCFIPTFMYATLGLYTLAFSGIRQSLAIGVVLLSVHFIIKRNFFYYAIMVALAMQFHLSAVIFIPAYFLYNVKFTNTYFVAFISAVILSFVFKDYIFSFIISFGLYSSYFITAYKTITITFIVYGSLFIFCYVLGWHKILVKEENYMFILASCYVLIMSMSSLNPCLGRFAFYYFFMLFISLDITIKQLPVHKRPLVILPVSALCMVAYPIFYMGGTGDIVPYIFFFE